MTHFKPSFLCNVIYKIVSKILANRLKAMLPRIISESQSAFVRNKHISNDILIAYKFIHALRCQISSNEGYLVMMLDMSKAYDRVEWPFLLNIMYRMSFSQRWTNMIHKCISTVLYSILFNGYPGDAFRL